MIVATAGHVDHGKTSLVRALTGIDTDRLPEEKRRGMTIEPGFAHADLGAGGTMGFVDVPGHERFLRHMVSGVAAVDFALLVVAADDGVMPQTLEHLAVLDLIGVSCGAVALSKIDRVTAARAAEVQTSIAALLDGSALKGAPVFPLSTLTGQGLDSLRAHLATVQRGLPPRLQGSHARLVVDRCFSRTGAGLVVTGTLLSGSVEVDDELLVSPSGSRVRVRALQVHGASVKQARAGQRCALNLVPASGDRLHLDRGDWIVAPALHAPTVRVDVALRWLATTPTALGADTTLQLHVGAAMRTVRATPLSARLLEPGASGLVQLVLEQPVSALHGDRVVLRDAAAQRTVGGGRVLDPWAPARGRARPARLADLAALGGDDPVEALAALLTAHPEGIEWRPFALARNLPDAQQADWLEGLAFVALPHAGGQRLISRVHWLAWLRRVIDVLAASHLAHPDHVGLPEATLLRQMGPAADISLRRSAMHAQLRAGAVARDGFVLRLPSHVARLQPDDEVLLARVVAILQPFALRPPPPGELAPLLDLDLATTSAFLQRAAALGHLVQVARNRFFLPTTVHALIDVAQACAAASPDGRFDVKGFRDRSGIGRNLSIQLLEFFDRSGITRYAAERRSMAASGEA